MRPRNQALVHPAAEELLRYATTGCPVDCGRNWTLHEMQTAIDHGAHKSARDPVAAKSCRREALDRAAEGGCRIIKWSSIKDNPPPNLKISPIAAIPHKSRLYRMILDLSFELKVDGTKLRSVNDSSDKDLAPHHSMYELGNVIPRIIWQMALAPDTGVPILFSKIDLKDGYWRMVVDEHDAWNFAYVLPPENPGDEPELVIPDALQMGWSESPPFFCAATETARDLAENYYVSKRPLLPHPMEKTVLDINWSAIPTTERDPNVAFLHLLEVYIDDFIALIHTTDKAEITRLTRSLLHAITDIFPPPEITGSSMGPAISEKKLIAEGTWETRKEILGWVLDGIARTIELPTKKCDKILAELRTARRSKTLKVTDLRKIQGKLQFASIGLPVGKPLLGPMDLIIAKAVAAKRSHIRNTDLVTTYFRNWAGLLHLMRSRPTHVRELTPRHRPQYRGLVDASKWGVGGVWFPGSDPLAPFVWFFEWPEAIRNALCTAQNPTGSLTISDLELMGVFMHWLALEQAVGTKLHHQSPAIWCDNLPAVAWTYKFRTSTSQIAANILRALATRLHVCQAGTLSVDHISGVYNVMADVASRKHTTNPSDFLTYFSSKFPPPKHTCWTLFQFSNKITSLICSELQQKPLTMASWRRLSVKGCAFMAHGPDGCLSTSPAFTLTYSISNANSKSISWEPSPTMCDTVAFLPENTKFAPKQSRWRFGPSPRRSNWMENRIPWQTRKASIQRRLASFSRATAAPTPPANPN